MYFFTSIGFSSAPPPPTAVLFRDGVQILILEKPFLCTKFHNNSVPCFFQLLCHGILQARTPETVIRVRREISVIV